MDKRLLVIGLIGGALAIAGVFLPWATMSVSGTFFGETMEASIDVTGFEVAKGEATIAGQTLDLGQTGSPVSPGSYPYIALAGGILALVGAVVVLASPTLKKIGALLAIGGILAIVGAAWGISAIETTSVTMVGLTMSVSYGYGLYLCLIGGILGLVGVLGLRGK